MVRMYTLRAIEMKKEGSDDWEVDYVEILDKRRTANGARRKFMFRINGFITQEPTKYEPESTITQNGNPTL